MQEVNAFINEPENMVQVIRDAIPFDTPNRATIVYDLERVFVHSQKLRYEKAEELQKWVETLATVRRVLATRGL